MFPSSLGANLGWQLGSVLYRQSGRPEPELSWSVGNIPATHQHVTGHHPPHYIYISTPFCLIYLHACFLLREVDTLTAFYPSFRTSGPVCLTFVFIFGKSVLTVTISASTMVKIVRVWRSSAPVQNHRRTFQILVASDFPNSKPLFDIIHYRL